MREETKLIWRLFYSSLFYLAMPFVIIRLLWRSRQLPDYRKRWRERFASFSQPVKEKGLWIHAVSFGESVIAIPLIHQFRKKHPNVFITVTNMTPTGSAKIQAEFGNDVLNLYLPYDLPCLMRRFIRRIKPALVVIMETELWPNLMWQLFCQKFPVILANGRLSEKSANNYKKIRLLMQPSLQAFHWLLVQTKAEANRYVALGCDRNKIKVTGSIKFDLIPPVDIDSQALEIRNRFVTANRPILVAASTHSGEENLILEACQIIWRDIPDLLLLLVPRHPERFDQVAQLCLNKNLRIVRYSENKEKTCSATTQVWLGDTMGKLFLFYAMANVVFVGGSLVPVGGHNLLEPAALGKAIITGPHTHNFLRISELLEVDQALYRIKDYEELAQKVVQLLQLPGLSRELGTNAKQVVEKNRGALQRHLEIIESFFIK